MKKLLKNSFLIISVTVLVLLVLEVGIRIADKNGDFLPPGKPGWIKFSSTLHYKIEPGYSGTIYGAPVGINSHGFRGPEILSKTKDEFRIVCLGNSCIFGNDLRYEDTISSILDSVLNENSDKPVKVINAGVPGYSSYQGLIQLKEEIITLEPDLLLVAFGFNDRRTVPDDSWKDNEDFFRRDYHAQKKMEMFRKSSLIRYIFKIIKMDENIPVIDGYNVRVEKFEYKNNIEEIVRTSESYKIPVVLFSIPDNPKYLEPYSWAVEAMDRDDFWLAKSFVEKNENIYSRMARRNYNIRLSNTDMLAEETTEYSDLMAFHGGLPIYTSTEYDIFLRAAAKAMNVPLIDLTNKLKPEDYIDFIHLNRSGSEKTARILVESIRLNGFINTDN